jgi:solute:Na+ symporter, SSS family
MHLVALDWFAIVAYFAISLGVGLYYSRRAGSNIQEFFASGRSLPWWIAGTSMVATTFAADTPLAVTSLVVKYGLAGNWFWWAFAVGGMLTVFIYARLWRRAEVLTDVELVELRYGGRPAAVLRGFRALYLSIPVNCIVMGWVNFAMLKVLKVTLLGNEMNDWVILFFCLGITGLYTMLSGLWGVAITDVIQFVLAMGGCIVLAVLAVRDVGGTAALQSRIVELYGSPQALSYLPDFHSSLAWMSLEMFLVYLFVLWWASWYPGAEPGGGGYIVQRMISCRDERHSLLATLWFQVAHYCLRPWPWLMCGLVALVKYPDLKTKWLADPSFDPGVGFPMLMRDLLPAGLRGLLLVAFFAAYMSTLSTQINWGASYLVNDFYKRFIRPRADDRHYTWAARIASVLILVIGGAMTAFITSVDQAWKFLAALGAGTGAVFMLRWFWWRINAWSEIVAMVSSLVYYLLIQVAVKVSQPGGWVDVLKVQEYQTAIVAGLTVVTWLAATMLTVPETSEVLLGFYRKVRPGGPGWAPVKQLAPDVRCDRNIGVSIVAAMLGTCVVYTVLPGLGCLIFGSYAKALILLGVSVACTWGMVFVLRRSGWAEIAR